MEARAKLWIKRLTAISLVLILVFVASYWKSTENIIDKMDIDNEENYIIKLEAGEQGNVDLSTIGYYMALRIDGNDSSPELKLTDIGGVEIEGQKPGLIESINKRPDSQGNLIYDPIRVFEIRDDGEYSIVNEGNTTLWLIDDFKIQSSLLSDGWILISMISCCLGFPLGIITLIGATTENPSFEVDKLAHGFAYFCFATSVFVALNLDWKLETAKKWTIISSFSLGLLLEIVQGSLLSYRSFEVYDLLANTLGIVFFIFSSKRVKKLLSNAVFL